MRRRQPIQFPSEETTVRQQQRTLALGVLRCQESGGAGFNPRVALADLGGLVWLACHGD